MMLKDFEQGIDELLSSWGLGKQADVTAQLPPTTNIVRDDVGDVGADAKRPNRLKTPNLQVSAKPLEGQGRLSGNGNTVQVVGRGFGGGLDVASAFKFVRSLAKERSISKLGCRRQEFRFLPFGPSEELNNERVLGVLQSALRFKYAGCSEQLIREKLASDPLVIQYCKLANSTKTALLDAGAQLLSGAYHRALPTGILVAQLLAGKKISPVSDPTRYSAEAKPLGPGVLGI